MKSIRKTAKEPVPPDWKEWDFRSITEAELPVAIRYEYARSDEIFRRVVAEWHRRPIMSEPWRQNENHLERFSGMTVKEALDCGFFELPEAVRRVIVQATPFQIRDCLEVAAWLFPEFPAPFQSIEPEQRKQRLVEMAKSVANGGFGHRFYKKAVSFDQADQFLLPDQGELAFRKVEKKSCVFYYTARIDWRCSKKQIQESFKTWLKAQTSPIKP